MTLMKNANLKSRNIPTGPVDPDPLSIVGGIAQALGLVEQLQRILNKNKHRSRIKHSRIEKSLERFRIRLDDARTAFRIIGSALQNKPNVASSEAGGLAIHEDELPVLCRGLGQLYDAIKAMTNHAYELENLTAHIPVETERFYRVSTNGKPVLGKIRVALDEIENEGFTIKSRLAILAALDEIDKYLASCSKILQERSDWFTA